MFLENFRYIMTVLLNAKNWASFFPSCYSTHLSMKVIIFADHQECYFKLRIFICNLLRDIIKNVCEKCAPMKMNFHIECLSDVFMRGVVGIFGLQTFCFENNSTKLNWFIQIYRINIHLKCSSSNLVNFFCAGHLKITLKKL